MTWTWIAIGSLTIFALVASAWLMVVLEIARRATESIAATSQSLAATIDDNARLKGENDGLNREIHGWRTEAAEAHSQIMSLLESCEKLANERDELFTMHQMTREVARRN